MEGEKERKWGEEGSEQGWVKERERGKKEKSSLSI